VAVQPDEALRIVGEVEEEEEEMVVMGWEDYTHVVDALAGEGRWEEAWMWMEKMKEKHQVGKNSEEDKESIGLILWWWW